MPRQYSKIMKNFTITPELLHDLIYPQTLKPLNLNSKTLNCNQFDTYLILA
jgi:hypothetical protein